MMEEKIKMPFTAPEGFFEESGSMAMCKAAKIRNRRRASLGGTLACGLVLALSVLGLRSRLADSYEGYSDEMLADMVELNSLDPFLSIDTFIEETNN